MNALADYTKRISSELVLSWSYWHVTSSQCLLNAIFLNFVFFFLFVVLVVVVCLLLLLLLLVGRCFFFKWYKLHCKFFVELCKFSKFGTSSNKTDSLNFESNRKFPSFPSFRFQCKGQNRKLGNLENSKFL